MLLRPNRCDIGDSRALRVRNWHPEKLTLSGCSTMNIVYVAKFSVLSLDRLRLSCFVHVRFGAPCGLLIPTFDL